MSMEAERIVREYLPEVENCSDTAYISIRNHGEDELHEEERNFLTVWFLDLEYDLSETLKAITEKQAKRIFNFIKDNSDKKRFIIHCTAGVSRSAAVGAFIWEYFGGAYKELQKTHPNIIPNGRVQRLLRIQEKIDLYGDEIIKF